MHHRDSYDYVEATEAESMNDSKLKSFFASFNISKVRVLTYIRGDVRVMVNSCCVWVGVGT